MRRAFCFGWFIFVCTLSTLAQTSLPPFTVSDRVIIVAPHPDDEVLGAGGAIQQAVAAGADVRVIYLTNGDHNQVAFKLYKHALHLSARDYLAFGERRRKEAIAATSSLGMSPDHLTFLGYPDWGTLTMWRDYWEKGEVFRSDATRVTAVPYKDAFSYQQSYKPQNVEADFVRLFREFKPTKVFVTHPADTNRDHRAAANFVRLAVLDVEVDGLRPQVFYYVVHFGHWSQPFHYHPELELRPPRALLDNGDWMSLSLTPAQTEKKYNAILLNRTQTTYGQYFLVSLARANEVFATMPMQTVPRVPADVAVDWRKAVRNKAIAYPMTEPVEMPNESEVVQPSPEQSIAIDHTDFLRQGNDLIAQIDLKNRLGKRTNVHLLLFGYKRGIPFENLPKVSINITPLGALHVYVGGRRVLDHGVTVTSVADRFFVRVPLPLLGGDDIDYVFTCTRAHLGEIAADDTAWQLFSVKGATSL
jgi:LmbE family N-acetylglucosaminyl deacetylase